MNTASLMTVVSRFPSKKILVVGDIMLDTFVWGNVDRISPEAPVPVVEIVRDTAMPGGCGNVANNILALGGKALVLTVVGDDANGERLRTMMRSSGAETDGIFSDTGRPTTVKTRIIAHNQQMVRIDRESRRQIAASVWNRIQTFLHERMGEIDAILISDYGKGVITRALLNRLIVLARRRDIPITVDPKIEHFLEYKRVTILTPNTNEAVQGMRCHRKPQSEEEMVSLGRRILQVLRSDALVITQGEKGMTLFEGRRVHHIPTRAKEVYDVTGAGDTVIASLTLALASGAGMRAGCEIGNFAAGVVVGKVGTATCSPQELAAIMREHAR